MDATRLKQIEEIYHAALEVSPDERESFFAGRCGDDEELRREVESLLSFKDNSEDFLETPPQYRSKIIAGLPKKKLNI